MSKEEYAGLCARVVERVRREIGNPISRETARLIAEKALHLNKAQRRMVLRQRHVSNAILISQELTELAFELSRRQPEEGLAAAKIAVEAAWLVPAYGHNRQIAWDLRAAATGKFANALRLVEDYQRARSTWKQAEVCQWRGSGDPQLAAELARARSSLARDERRFGESAILLKEAIGWSAGIRDQGVEAKSRIKLGYLCVFLQDYQAALKETLAGAELLSHEEDGEVMMGALHNIAVAAAESGAIKSALWLLLQNLPRYQKHATPDFHLRLHWTFGKLAHQLGDFFGAGTAFDQIRREFIRRKQPFDASIASLDLALVYLKLGQHKKVRELAEEMLAVFRAKQIPREASAALLLFVEAARREAATVEAVEQLTTDLKARLAPAGKSLPVGKYLA